MFLVSRGFTYTHFSLANNRAVNFNACDRADELRKITKINFLCVGHPTKLNPALKNVKY